MLKVAENLWIIDELHDLLFSEDDDEKTGKGWYIQKSFPKPIWRMSSQLFKSKQQAMDAFKSNNLVFTK